MNDTTDSDGLPSMTKDEIRRIALAHGGYTTPALNDQLFLHFKGYRRIENLDAYTNLKALWLESNGLQVIENLDQLKMLRCLFLQRNLISRIENLQHLQNLVQIDLSENRISFIDGLSDLPALQVINLSKNYLTSCLSIEHLTHCSKLTTVDLSSNELQGEDVIQVLAQIPSLVILSLAGNPVHSDVPNFRKRCIVAMKNLLYLDKPIFEMDRATAEAWFSGGKEAEMLMRKQMQEERKAADRKSFEAFRQWQLDVKAKAELTRHRIETQGYTATEIQQSRDREIQLIERKEKASVEAERECQLFAIPQDSEVPALDFNYEDTRTYSVHSDDGRVSAEPTLTIGDDESAECYERITEEVESSDLNDSHSTNTESDTRLSSYTANSQSDNSRILAMPTLTTYDDESAERFERIAETLESPDLNVVPSTTSPIVPSHSLPQDDSEISAIDFNYEETRTYFSLSDESHVLDKPTLVTAYVESSEHCERIAKDSATVEYPTYWTDDMDKLLLQTVQECSYDFLSVAQILRTDSDICHNRWCLLDALTHDFS